MATPGRLTNAPIQEALVDLRIANTGTIDLAVLEPLKQQFRSRYPKSEPYQRMEARIEARPGHSPEVSASSVRFHGLFLKNEDESKIVQFRLDGFTLSQLKNYTTADDLFRESLGLWQGYASVVHATTTIRVALRYINRLLLPFRDGDSFERFLTTPATMPPGTPQLVAEFLTRQVAYVDSIASTAIVTQRLEHSTEQATPFTLDIDVFKEQAFNVDAGTLEPFLQRLREVKNSLFFSFLKDEALEPYR